MLVGTFAPTDALAGRREVRQEVQEGAKSVRKGKKEAALERNGQSAESAFRAAEDRGIFRGL